MDFEQAIRRYRNDPAYARIVDIMYHAIDELQLTPGEMRDAAMLAALKWEQNHWAGALPLELAAAPGL